MAGGGLSGAACSLILAVLCLAALSGLRATGTLVPEARRVGRAVGGSGLDLYALRDTEIFLASSDLAGLLPGASAGQIEAWAPGGGIMMPTQAFLVKWDGGAFLVDAGWGWRQNGLLLESLALAGVAPGGIGAVLLTHLHADHAGGLERGGRAVFPEAVLYAHQAELDTWIDGPGVARLPEIHRRWVPPAQAALAPNRDRVRALEDSGGMGGSVPLPLPGADMAAVFWPMPSHTPGHVLYGLTCGGAKDAGVVTLCLFTGDLMVLPEIQLPRPRVSVLFDMDPEEAGASRLALLRDMACGPYRDKTLILGSHLPWPGAGRVEARGEGFIFRPVADPG